MVESGRLDGAETRATALLEGIYHGVSRLHEIVEEMLDVTRIEAKTLSLKISPVQLEKVAEKAIAVYQEIAEQRNVTVTVEPMGHLPIIWADGARTQQMLAHLIGNAIKYTPDGGRITVSGRQVGRDTSVTTPGHVQGDQFVELIVADTGIGIDPDEQDRIFEQFYEVRDPRLHSTSKSEFMGGGAGLGLAITRGVVEAHGGWVWVESEGYDPVRCLGSRFHVVLPVGEHPER
jgi:signal transduction histidine kinase